MIVYLCFLFQQIFIEDLLRISLRGREAPDTFFAFPKFGSRGCKRVRDLTPKCLAPCEDLAITLLGKDPNELKTYIRTKTRARMFITALFTIAKTRN